MDRRGGGADIPAAPPRQLRKQLNGPLLTIPGAVTGFEGFEGGSAACTANVISPEPVWLKCLSRIRQRATIRRYIDGY
jgi:hypothetical protein